MRKNSLAQYYIAKCEKKENLEVDSINCKTYLMSFIVYIDIIFAP